MNDVWKKIWTVVKNKYVAATLIFVVIIAFVDENNLLLTSRLHREVHALHAEEQRMAEGIVADSIQAVALKHDKAAIERYGREVYYMKRADEDIYIVTSEK